MPAPIILMYHYIERPSPLCCVRGLYTTPRRFEWQLKWLLRNRYTFSTFEKIPPDSYEDQPDKTVILTFDDGSVSVFRNGFPILQKFHIPAVIFPITSLIEKEELSIPGSANKAPVSFLSLVQIRLLSDAGWETGSHLVSHKPVTELNDQEISNELTQSKHILEQITGKPVITVAYPYGSYDQRILQMAKQAGFIYGVTTGQDPLGIFPLLELRRNNAKGTRWYHRFPFKRIFRIHEHQGLYLH